MKNQNYYLCCGKRHDSAAMCKPCAKFHNKVVEACAQEVLEASIFDHRREIVACIRKVKVPE